MPKRANRGIELPPAISDIPESSPTPCAVPRLPATSTQFGDPAFTGFERLRGGVDRIIAEMQMMGMRHRRARGFQHSSARALMARDFVRAAAAREISHAPPL